MRSTLVLIALIITSLNISNAQKNFSPYSEIGIKVIGSSFNIGLNQTYDEVLAGTGLGVSYLHVGEKILGVLIEANYNNVGSIVENNIVETSIITLPFFTHIYVPIKKSSIFINLGPYISFNLSQKLADGFNQADNSSFIGLGGGMGYKRNLTKSSFSIEGRYHFNLTENYNQKANTAPKRTVWAEVALSYAFKL